MRKPGYIPVLVSRTEPGYIQDFAHPITFFFVARHIRTRDSYNPLSGSMPKRYQSRGYKHYRAYALTLYTEAKIDDVITLLLKDQDVDCIVWCQEESPVNKRIHYHINLNYVHPVCRKIDYFDAACGARPFVQPVLRGDGNLGRLWTYYSKNGSPSIRSQKPESLEYITRWVQDTIEHNKLREFIKANTLNKN